MMRLIQLMRLTLVALVTKLLGRVSGIMKLKRKKDREMNSNDR